VIAFAAARSDRGVGPPPRQSRSIDSEHDRPSAESEGRKGHPYRRSTWYRQWGGEDRPQRWRERSDAGRAGRRVAHRPSFPGSGSALCALGYGLADATARTRPATRSVMPSTMTWTPSSTPCGVPEVGPGSLTIGSARRTTRYGAWPYRVVPHDRPGAVRPGPAAARARQGHCWPACLTYSSCGSRSRARSCVTSPPSAPRRPGERRQETAQGRHAAARACTHARLRPEPRSSDLQSRWRRPRSPAPGDGPTLGQRAARTGGA